jgi:hypothetical protein
VTGKKICHARPTAAFSAFEHADLQRVRFKTEAGKMSGFGEFFAEGGWGMYPVLIFGLSSVGGAIWFALKPEPRRLAFTAAMWLTLVSAIVHATWTDLAAVMAYLSETTQKQPDAQVVPILFQGLKESTRPGTMGGTFLTLALLIVGIGSLRAPKND